MPRIRVALCQLNPVVGDIEGNLAKIEDAAATARSSGADLIVFPELAVTGYPPEDLLLKPAFVGDNLKAIDLLADSAGAAAMICGYVDQDGDLFNAAAVVHRGVIAGRYHKQVLPNYGPFDEQRYFRAAEPPSILYSVGGVNVGVTVCEDVWLPHGPVAHQAGGGAELIVNINASPFYTGRIHEREAMLAERARQCETPIVYVNQVGGQDELVFDGGSMVVGADGRVLARAAQFVEEVLIVDIDVPRRTVDYPLAVLPITPDRARHEDALEALVAAPIDGPAEIYNALVLGTADYVRKNGFDEVVVAMSGGIDSTLVATIAVDAIGSANVHGVLLPSRYSSAGSTTDAQAHARNLGIDTRTIAIEPAHGAFAAMLCESMGDVTGLTEENLQSRIRGVVMMALSNEFGWLVLTTGNKSELAVGYSTLYGDTAGGFAVIKDVAKTQVYELCQWRNEVGGKPVIPEEIIVKPPSAELRPGQRDDDSLPPYEVLDAILESYVEHDRSVAEIAQQGFDAALVERIVRLVDRAEYKRRQSPLGVRVTAKAFGKDRRVPITNRYPWATTVEKSVNWGNR